jgi:cytochrome c peroxidase
MSTDSRAAGCRGFLGRLVPSSAAFVVLLTAGVGPAAADPRALQERAATVLAALPERAENPCNPSTPERVELGKLLYHDVRLSKSQEISCNSCHQLDRFGVDGEATSPGQRGQRGARNSPTVYNAALQFRQFWDGRAADVEEQAQGPVLNPIEMAMPDAAAVEAVLRSIPGYQALFAAAFPEADSPLGFVNMARAIAAFERTLLTPSRLDHFLVGELGSLNDQEQRGLELFLDVGCTTCHNGVAVGGGSYQKLGLVRPYATEDTGRMEVTGDERDKYFFKVPTLRNVAETGPWFHDGSITSLEEAVQKMGWHQLGRELEPEQIADLVSFLSSLTGTPPAASGAAPVPLPSGPETPAPDPS